MTPQEIKNQKIREKGKETRSRRQSMTCLVREIKLTKLSRKDKQHLHMMFVEAKWIYNHYLSHKQFDNKTVIVLDKDKNPIQRQISHLGSQMKQDVVNQIKDNIKGLSAAKSKGNKVGALRFKSELNSINLRQYGITYQFKDGKLKIQGYKKLFKVFGLHQILDDYELANAKLVKKADGYYVKVTCFADKKLKENLPSVGLDFGIKTSITTSDGDKFDISIKESEHLKRLQQALSRKKKGSNNRYKNICNIRRAHEKITNKRQDKANQIVGLLTKTYSTIYMQDENLKGWHKGLFGKQVQHSALGTVKQKLITKGAVLIDRFAPTTKQCLICGEKLQLTLSDREFSCGNCGYVEDRDIKAALTVLQFGTQGQHLVPMERRNHGVSLKACEDRVRPVKRHQSQKQEARDFSHE